MSESMIERVARVLCEASGESWREPPYNHLHTDRLNNHWRYKARRVIEEMRNHTPAMDSAGYDAYPESVIKTGVDHLDIYRAMIDAALSEEVE